MKKNILIAAGIFLLIVGLAAITGWRFKKWTEGFGKEALFKSETFGLQNLNEQLGGGLLAPGETFQEFISPDGKFRIEYPLNWLATDQKDILDTLAPEGWIKKYDLRTLLLARTAQEGGSSQLIVYGGHFDLSIEEIIKEMKKIVESYDWEMKIIKSDIKENEGTFEAEYQIPDSPKLRSKEKILTNKKDAYIISLMAPEKDWEALKEDIDKILNSGKIEEKE